MTASLETKDLIIDLSGRRVLHGINLSIAAGSVVAVIGPNGCGKSTLLRTMTRILAPTSGQVFLDGTDIWQMPPRTAARTIAFLPQASQTPEGIRVRTLVERGRTPHMRPFQPLRTADRDAVDRALFLTGMTDLADRRVDRLSGGQRQRAWIALVLAQDTPVLVLDEPTTYLDLPHQIDLLRLINRLNKETGKTIIMVLHDLNLASHHTSRIIALRDGKVAFDGAPSKVINSDNLATLFGTELNVQAGSANMPPLVMPS
ncbi:ABC transporter ATP-binding protein [Sulfitobacter sp. DFL-23]|uniref:ABC transporter ATP-binding protein n=1 Tax=Roseobacteraceae TaxID=2854170 RepID=UPI000DF4ADB8|nr:ABC transporter ATP-binding protein [Sulfitobacter sp. DFL-23]